MKARLALVMAAFSLVLTSATAPAKEPSKESSTPIDSGSFGVFMNGRRVATETFSIQQTSTGSVITSEFKAEQGQEQAVQSSELQLNSNGDIRKYEWKELSPGKTQAVVMPKDEFLIESVTDSPGNKALEQPFMVPASTSILDDYFFIQREVLAWKFLALGCRQQKGEIQCPKDQKTHFGALNPHGRSSLSVSMAFSGNEKLTIHGAEQDVSRYNLKSDSGDWMLWLDGHNKLVRIVVVGDSTGTEVVRD
ncbi:MAG: hypothetical protein WB421_07840 [Terriglobales bacterium]